IHFITGAVKMTQRPYEFMLLSDHGQSMGATFRQRYGASLAELLRQLVGEENGTHGAMTSISEGVDYISMILSALTVLNKRHGGILNRVMRGQPSSNGRKEWKEPHNFATETKSTKVPKTVVCASGNLAHVYFAEHDSSLTLEEIDAAYPEITKTLINHPGIS